jgi:hypothetical protein
VKLAAFEHKYDQLDEGMKDLFAKLKAGFANRQVAVGKVLEDGDILPYFGAYLPTRAKPKPLLPGMS